MTTPGNPSQVAFETGNEYKTMIVGLRRHKSEYSLIPTQTEGSQKEGKRMRRNFSTLHGEFNINNLYSG